MKTLEEKRLIAAEIASNVHKQIVCEEARRLVKKYSGDQLLLAHAAMMNLATITARHLMSKVDYAKLGVALQQYKERVKNTFGEVPE